MDRDLVAARLASNKFLGGLVERFGEERVDRVGRKTLGYPPELATSHKEALAIQQALEN